MTPVDLAQVEMTSPLTPDQTLPLVHQSPDDPWSDSLVYWSIWTVTDVCNIREKERLSMVVEMTRIVHCLSNDWVVAGLCSNNYCGDGAGSVQWSELDCSLLHLAVLWREVAWLVTNCTTTKTEIISSDINKYFLSGLWSHNKVIFCSVLYLDSWDETEIIINSGGMWRRHQVDVILMGII